ncbi:MAG: helix-turn-helix domain-containing protein [Cyanobacteria bacterium]|nr:helix-turn-helix domain-containing protein [Cyanobacteriota bacterium]
MPIEDVFISETFYPAFQRDLERSEHRVIIQSPYIALPRVEFLSNSLMRAVNKGVRVCVFIQEPDSWKADRRKLDDHTIRQLTKIRAAISLLENTGLHVTLRPGIHEKMAVIDEAVFWDGSLNILSQSRSSERMTRWTSISRLKHAIELHELDKCEQCSNAILTGENLIRTQFHERRNQLGITQRDLAAMCNLNQSSISRVENSSDEVTLGTVRRVADELDLEILLVPKYKVQKLLGSNSSSR